MKKIVIFIVSIALFISCFAFSTKSGGIVAGAGMGTNEKVENVEELAELIEFLMQQNYDDEASSNGGDMISNNQGSSVEYLAKKSKNKYKSATVTITTALRASSSSSYPKYTGGFRSSKQELDRELTLYFTDDGTFYKSKGYYSVSTENDDGKISTETFKFDVDILVMDDETYINIREWVMSSDSYSMQIKYENINRWIEMPLYYVDGFIDLDDANREVLGEMGQFLDYLIESDEVDDSDKHISIDEYDFSKIYEDISGEEMDIKDYELDFTCDLSSPTTPYISIVSKTDKKDTHKVPDYYNGNAQEITVNTTNKVKNSQELVISNIDNTVISFDYGSVEISVEDDDEFEDLFIIEERSEDDD